MKIGVIASSKISYIAEGSKKSEEDVKKMLDKVAEVLAKDNYEIIITPDKNSPLEYLGKEYLKFKGKKIYEVLPLEDKEFGYKEWVNTDLGEAINCKVWRNQPETTCEVSNVLLCVGYGVGSMIEMGYTKWFKNAPILIITELVSGKLPPEFEKSLKIKYISVNDLDKELKKLR